MPQTRKKVLKLDKKTDLTSIIVKTVIEIGEDGGSSTKKIENQINTVYNIECQNGVDLSTLLKSCLKTAIDNKYLAKEGRSIKLGEKAESFVFIICFIW
jgi:hypothetical protein